MSVTRLSDTVDALDMTQDLPFQLLHADPRCTIILYKPQPEDLQTPHEQDEFYFVASGSADIVIEGERSAVRTGDAIFVPAMQAHRFEHSSDDFACWGLFLNQPADKDGG